MYGGIKTGQVSVDTTAGGTLIAAARVGRGAITIINHSTTVVYVGDTGLTTSTGAYVAGVAGASITLSTQAAIYGITGSGSETVGYVETY